MNCPVCSAPAVPLDGICVFCHAPLGETEDAGDLLDYLLEHIPLARARHGHLNRGPVTEVTIDVEGRSFHARVREGDLDLAPAVRLTAWVDLLLTKLSDAAGADADLRRSYLRSGWALR